MIKISGLIWRQEVIDKLEAKHHLAPEEVEEVFSNRPRIRFLENGDLVGQDLFAAYGRTNAGRYVTVIYLLKPTGQALIVTGRDMDRKERKQYGK